MNRNIHSLSRPMIEAYWLALNDMLEREVLTYPETVIELERQIRELEQKVGEDKANIAYESIM